jgi:hypothetical protein
MYDCSDDGYEPTIWHKVCYHGAPKNKQNDLTPSKYAPNQGFGAPNPRFL